MISLSLRQPGSPGIKKTSFLQDQQTHDEEGCIFRTGALVGL